MSVITNNLLLGDEGYFLNKSLRFRSSASAYLNRTLSASNRKTFTFNAWVKKSVVGSSTYQSLFCSTDNLTSTGWLHFNVGNYGSTDALTFEDQLSGTVLSTTQVFRDPSAWYMITLSIDTTQATASNRAKLYVNGTQITAFSTATYPSQNADTNFNRTSSFIHTIGSYYTNNAFFNGYLTEINFIDGQALTPSSFGETSTSTGVWIPKKYTGTYGTNGFYLPFTDVATTSGSNAGLGKDFSGNGNYWTTNNISVTTGTTYDSMSDVPTLTSATAANYCTLNPLDRNTNLALSNGNLTAIPSTDADYWLGRATMQLPSTGKWYWELTLNNTPYLYQAGIYSANRPNSGGTSATGNEYQVAWGTAWTYIMYQSNNAAFAAWGTNTNPTSGNVLMFAVDSDNGTMWVGRNGTWYNTSGTANPATNTDPRFSSIPSGLFAGVNLPNPASGGVSMNFGQQGFAYTPPSGFKALNTFNLPTPTIGATASTVANKYMDATLYTGAGNTSTSITNAGGFQPDFVWTKARSIGYSNYLYDAVRGTGTGASLVSNGSGAEGADASNANLSSFNSNGWTIGTTSGTNALNASGQTFVAWQWKANGSGSSNTAGSITSTVSANTTAGFSIVKWTGTSGSSFTIGHGLGVTPNMIILKNRSRAGTEWCVYHQDVGNTKALFLNSTGTGTTDSGFWNNTNPSSTVFTTGNGYLYYTGGISDNYVAYCFAQVAGYSAFGSYTGNNSADGTFVFTGFRPRYIMWKASTAAYNWNVIDTSRNPYNVTDALLRPNTSDAESIGGGGSGVLDILSNGFKLRSAYAGWNDANTYIYMAFAENPFKFSNAR